MTNILFVHDPKNETGSLFVHSLRRAMPDQNIQIKEAGVATLLLDTSEHDLVHFFHSASSRISSLVKKTKGKTKTVQTVLSTPSKKESYKKILFGNQAVVFSESEKIAAEKQADGISVTCVLPCMDLPPVSERKPAGWLRSEFAAEDLLLTVGFVELNDQEEFMSALYIAREYQRRKNFRLLLFLAPGSRKTETWKERLQTSIQQEKLLATTILNSTMDPFSVIDGSDLVLYLVRGTASDFSFPVPALQALSLGKPMLCYNVPPVSDVVRGFQPAWVLQNTEDVVRNSVDISKEAVHLEQISTEVARYMQSRLLPENVASQYRTIYSKLIQS
jgi:glycosyltransferase involved in cell wall biosynthesis